MYGFNKVNDIVHSTLRQESQAWEFRHAHFKRGSVEELAKIKRKSVRSMRSTAPLHVEDDYHYYPDRLCQDMSLRVAQITQNYQNLRNNLVYIRQVVQSQQTVSNHTMNEASDSHGSIDYWKYAKYTWSIIGTNIIIFC